MAQKRDYYEVLGVAREAAADEIKRAYRKLAGANHPDRNPGDEEAVTRFKEAAEAYEVLSDEQKRGAYDRYGHAAFEGGRGRAGGAGFQDASDIFSAFGDIFGDIFGNAGGGGRGGRRGQNGASLRCAVSIDLREAATGCTREIEISRDELCETCQGSGAKAGSRPESCSYCGGRGQIVQSQGFFRMQTTCPACHGEGEVVRDKCGKCQGTGREAKKARLEIKVPAGVDNGMQLCLRGEGEPGVHGGRRGDLYCDIHVSEHPLFRREANHLHCPITITFAQAALGTEFDIPLLDGQQSLEIPAGTQPGATIRIRGQGMPDPRNHRKGDLHVEISVEVPKKLTERQEELIRELADLEKKHVRQHQKSMFEKIKEYFSPVAGSEEKD
jgi:molecular chaperone DnaJ